MEIKINSLFELGDKFYYISNNKLCYYYINQIQYSGIEEDEESNVHIKYALHKPNYQYCVLTPSEKELVASLENHNLFTSKKDAIKYLVEQL